MADQLVARHIKRAQKHSTLDPSTLSVWLLSDLREQATCTPRQPFSAPSSVQYTVKVTQEELKVTQEELETQKAAERHIAARKREREEEERRAAQQREQRAAQRPQHAPQADNDARASVDERLAQLIDDNPPPRRRWRHR